MLGPPGEDLPLGLPQPRLRVGHGSTRLVTVTLAAYVLCLPRGRCPLGTHAAACYLTKYQFSGLMLSVGLIGVAPFILLATSLSW